MIPRRCVRGLQGRGIAVVAALTVALLAVSTACQSPANSQGEGDAGGKRTTWVHGTLTPKADTASYLLMAREREYYAKQGVDVEVKQFVGNVQLIQALVSGAIDSGDTSPDAVYPAVERGAAVKIIGSTVPKATYAILARSDVRSFQDLQGKTVGVSAPGSTPDLVIRALLNAKNLDAKKVGVVNAGNDLQRYKALLAGRVDAVSVSVEFVPRIENNPKLHVLTLTQDAIPQYPRFFLVANERSLESKRQAAVRFLAAEMQGVCYAREHPREAAKVTAKLLDTSPKDPGIAYSRKVLTDTDAASPTSAIPIDRLTFLNDFLVKTGRLRESTDPATIVDDSLRESAVKRARLPKACMNDPNAT